MMTMRVIGHSDNASDADNDRDGDDEMCSEDQLKYIDKETRERLLVAFANEVIFRLRW